MKQKFNSIKEFHKAFKRFIWSDMLVLNIIPDHGWIDGGCRSLMKALALWLGQENIAYYQLVKGKEETHSEHALVKIGDYFIDGDGISTYYALYKRWRRLEKFPSIYIRPFNPENEPALLINGKLEPPYYIKDDSIQLLVKALESSFDKKNVIELLLKNSK
ncbi:hypothetical protein [Cytobacillus oceanisediminis]|uniref:hypothetical protein n=1 Tax=Cytobacillus oceanisediminis TaxID=665099 RepID=UPI001FB55623|nr:hypothetical protein [Cytobacillus oceanisediminis]UOE58144.1 hypothetical protein IRB79_26935 [Cytobacillus oceanisediminis]